MNDGTLRDEMARGQRAADLLRNELLINAFTELEKQYHTAWRTTDASDADRREYLFKLFTALSDVKGHLDQIVETGELAKRQLDDLSGRKRLF
jgi:hypothetical protein